MKKRGQSEVIKYVFIAFTILAIIFFGYKSLATIKDKSCSAELAKFEIDLKNLDETVKFGDVLEISHQVPCSANEILFFDLNKKDKIASTLTNLNPIIIDSIESNVEKNVFVVKNNKILSSFYAGNMDIDFPNYLCFLPKFEKIEFVVEGHGTSVSVFGACQQPECTYYPLNTSDEESIGIINEAVGFNNEIDSDCGQPGKSSCPSDIKDEYIKLLRTQDSVDIFRKYEYCRETGKTNVEILIKPDKVLSDKEFRFYEFIPKECIDDLNKYLSTQIEGEVSIKYDPLIIWSFDDIKEEQKLRYILDTILSSDCRESIEGIGISDIPEGVVDVVIPPDVDDIIEGLTNLNLEVDDITLNGASAKKVVNLKSKTTYNGDKKYLDYSIIGVKENDVIECDIKNEDLLECESKDNQLSSLTITVQVTNGQVITLDTLIVNIIPTGPTCVPECTIPEKQCFDSSNYQDCILINNCPKWDPNIISCDVIGVGFECVDAGQCQAIVPPVCVPECTIPSKQCFDPTNYQDCILINNCPKWDPNIISCDVVGVGFVCEAGVCAAAVIPGEASLSLDFSDVDYQFQGGSHIYFHTRTFTESNGVGAILTQGQICSQQAGCDPKGSVNYIINRDGQLIHTNKRFITPFSSNIITLTYWGTDDNGNPITVSNSMTVSGSTHNP